MIIQLLQYYNACLFRVHVASKFSKQLFQRTVEVKLKAKYLTGMFEFKILQVNQLLLLHSSCLS